MACSSCAKKRIESGQAQITRANLGPPVNGDSAAVLIEYIGAASGNRRFRAPSGQIYSFGRGQTAQRYVLKDDAAYFLGMTAEFHLMQTPEVGASPDGSAAGPVLVAEGPPA